MPSKRLKSTLKCPIMNSIRKIEQQEVSLKASIVVFCWIYSRISSAYKYYYILRFLVSGTMHSAKKKRKKRLSRGNSCGVFSLKWETKQKFHENDFLVLYTWKEFLFGVNTICCHCFALPMWNTQWNVLDHGSLKSICYFICYLMHLFSLVSIESSIFHLNEEATEKKMPRNIQ